MFLLGGPGGGFGGPSGDCLCCSKSSGKATTETIRKTASTRTTKHTTVSSCVKSYTTYFWGDPLIKGRDYSELVSNCFGSLLIVPAVVLVVLVVVLVVLGVVLVIVEVVASHYCY